jgi:AAA+ superfamily predicted ATPase
MRDFTYNYNNKKFTIHSVELKKELKEITGVSELYSEKNNVQLNLDLLKINIKKIKNAKDKAICLGKLYRFLEKITKDDIGLFENLLQDKKILYKHLMYYFEVGMKVFYFENRYNSYIAGKISMCDYFRKRSYDDDEKKFDDFKDSFDIEITCFVSNGKKFSDFTNRSCIYRSEEALKLENLPFFVLTDKQYQYFQTKNLKLVDMLTGIHYLSLKGKIYNKCGNALSCSGRVIVDQEYYDNIDNDDSDDEEDLFLENNLKEQIDSEGNIITKEGDSIILEKENIKDNEWMIIPYIAVYNIDYKVWGLTHASNLSKINFRSDAFNKVVMEQEKKQLIKKVIEFGSNNNLKNQSQWDDIVEGKSGGLIFLLHGLPGLGKTLIAESSAELLNRPLISITAGQLGTEASEIEGYLHMYLKRAKRWNAILLIDEADVFMEERDNNIERNALVTIFLRMLERFDGILFLTTNRVSNIDIAIKSRMSIILHYKPFTQAERKQVWNNLVLNSKIVLSESDFDELSTYELNGREIKHCLKMAIATADQGETVTLKNIKSVLKYVMV